MGNDKEGAKVIKYLNDSGIDITGVETHKQYETGQVNVILNDKGVTSYDI